MERLEVKYAILLLALAGCGSTPSQLDKDYIDQVRAFRTTYVMTWIQRDPDLRTPEGAAKLQIIQDAIAAQAQYETIVLAEKAATPPEPK